MTTVSLSVDLINSILNYLSKKPFNEVNGLMGNIMLEVKKFQEDNQMEFPFPSEEEDSEKNVTN